MVLTVAFASATVYDSTLRSTTTLTATSTTVMSVTNTVTSFSIATVSPLQNAQRVTILNGVWNFTVQINANAIPQSQSLYITSKLTNISPVDQTVPALAQPTFIPTVYYANNGSVAWTWETTQATQMNYTVGKGQSLGESTNIPMSGLPIGQRIFFESALSQ